jgi:tRNA pseudouridine38-40 synthase
VAIARVTGLPTRVVGAGRTDAGVHATGQVVSFQTTSRLGVSALQAALNAVLPEDVAVVSAAEAPPGFHARFSARSREYRYTIWNAPERPVVGRQYVYHWRSYLDATAMDQAARVLVGRHDFAAFAGSMRATERAASTVRTLFRLHCWRENQRVIVEAVADAFLPHMVRNLVGTLVPVGMHRATVDDVRAILASRDRRRAGVTVPARGLCLTRVEYD